MRLYPLKVVEVGTIVCITCHDMEDDVKFKSFISLIAAMLLVVGCGTAEDYTTATTATVTDQLDSEDGSESQGSEPSEHKDLVVPVAGGAVAVVCAAIPGCRGFFKNGAIKIKDGTGKVVAVIKKPFQKLFKKSDEAAEAGAKTTDEAAEATEQTAKNTDEATEEAK